MKVWLGAIYVRGAVSRGGRSGHIMSGSITIIKPQLGATNGNLSNLELSLAVGVIVGSD